MLSESYIDFMTLINEIIRTKRKTIALIVDHDGRLIVRAPYHIADEQIEYFVAQKADWIKTKQRLADELYPKVKPKEYIDGEGFLFLGRSYPLEIVDELSQPLVLDGKFQLLRSNLSKAEEVFTNWYRKQARRVITERVNRYVKIKNYEYERIRITSARKRWGSCGQKGSLNFTWRLVMALTVAIDYVVVHELVHLEQKNHSKDFWGKVESLMPEYKTGKSWLKKNGYLLSL